MAAESRAQMSSSLNTVKLGPGWGGAGRRLRGLWPRGVVGAFDVPLGVFPFDDARVCAASADWIQAAEQATHERHPGPVTGVRVLRGKNRPRGRWTGG